MRKFSLFICGIFLLNSPSLCLDESINKGIDFVLEGKFFPWACFNCEKTKVEELQEVAAINKDIQQPVTPACNTMLKQKSNNIEKFFDKNEGTKAHFVGDVYGWAIVYY